MRSYVVDKELLKIFCWSSFWFVASKVII